MGGGGVRTRPPGGNPTITVKKVLGKNAPWEISIMRAGDYGVQLASCLDNLEGECERWIGQKKFWINLHYKVTL